ncbi:hypothetical protein I553_2529 [Mycobacterium xenopi 4042]|uniref:Uncharacterized protein n=1 Tax=Mycobacterium xenopi 4042 TaxID=1299334 RepID=X8CA81_MYCXE|nr:hypothetical protein I553_2529 [Mycobacterium xenopi 4042]
MRRGGDYEASGLSAPAPWVSRVKPPDVSFALDAAAALAIWQARKAH